MVLVLSFTDFCGTTYLRVDQIFGWQNIFHPVINSISFTPPWALSFNRAGLGTRVLGGLHFCLLLAWAMAVAWRGAAEFQKWQTLISLLAAISTLMYPQLCWHIEVVGGLTLQSPKFLGMVYYGTCRGVVACTLVSILNLWGTNQTLHIKGLFLNKSSEQR